MPTGTATYELGECVKLDAVAEFEIARDGMIEYEADSLFVSVENGDEFIPGNIVIQHGNRPERLCDFLIALCHENLE